MLLTQIGDKGVENYLNFDNNTHHKIISKIKQIQNVITDGNFINKNSCNVGVIAGIPGIAVFIHEYQKCFKLNTYELNDKIEVLIENCITAINDGDIQHSFCNGIAGFCWFLNYLTREEVLDKEDIEFIETCNDFFLKKIEEDGAKYNWDYLHGFIGVGVYYLACFQQKHIIKIVEQLEKVAIKDLKQGWALKSNEYNLKMEPNLVYNFSLAHGMASVIYFLSKLKKTSVFNEKTKGLINKLVEFTLLFQNKSNEKYCFFPSSISIETFEPSAGGNSRLAWCYGDLGIAIAIYQAGISLNNKTWINFAIEVFKHAAKRRDLKENSVIDAGICHGTAGIAHIFNRMYRNTGIEEFKETSKFWILETLKMAKFEDGLAGYKAYQGHKNGWENEYSLLEGIAGIGLALIASISESDPTWDECLLLS